MQRHLLAVKEWFQGKGLHLRSDKWSEVEKRHLKEEPVCQWCGGAEKLNVHHIKPFHLFPALELDDGNLITLCEVAGCEDHLEKGHLGNFKKFNPDIREQCIAHNKGQSK